MAALAGRLLAFEQRSRVDAYEYTSSSFEGHAKQLLKRDAGMLLRDPRATLSNRSRRSSRYGD